MLTWSLKLALCVVAANLIGYFVVRYLPFMSFLTGPVVGFAILFVMVPYWQRTLKEVRAQQARDQQPGPDA
jgi:hypothetical protein